MQKDPTLATFLPRHWSKKRKKKRWTLLGGQHLARVDCASEKLQKSGYGMDMAWCPSGSMVILMLHGGVHFNGGYPDPP